jgi:site-specific recombinase XerD
MPLLLRGKTYHYAFCYQGRRYRGSCKTSNERKAQRIEAAMFTKAMENENLPVSKKVPTLAIFSDRFFDWLDALPSDRTPKPRTRRYYKYGWDLLEPTELVNMRLGNITADDVLATPVGSSPSTTNKALRTLRHMLHKATGWGLIANVPVIRLVEEFGRESLIEPWMEQKLLAVTAQERVTPKGKKSRVGWDPFRTVLLIMLDSGLRPGEIFQMRWENIHWGSGVIFNPRGKSKKSRRFVPLTARVSAALKARENYATEGWVFPSKKAKSGHITDREVSKQWLEAKALAGIPSNVVMYCARHTFATDALEGTGNPVAVMDALGHARLDTTRIYVHPGVEHIRDVIERRNRETVQ